MFFFLWRFVYCVFSLLKWENKLHSDTLTNIAHYHQLLEANLKIQPDVKIWGWHYRSFFFSFFVSDHWLRKMSKKNTFCRHLEIFEKMACYPATSLLELFCWCELAYFQSKRPLFLFSFTVSAAVYKPLKASTLWVSSICVIIHSNRTLVKSCIQELRVSLQNEK